MPINVRWRPDVSTPQRAALEARFHLANGERREGTTWSYQLTDPSFLTIHELVRDPAVDDTANINRRLFRPALADDRVARIVLGALVVGAVAALVPFIRSRGRIVSRTIVVDERTIVRVAGAAPAALVAGAVMLLLLALVRYQPLWASKDVPLTEAARHGDIAEVFRLVNAGADPNPALEAGVESRQVEVLQVLVNAGATADESRRQRLACLAVAVTAPEVSDYLRSTLPSATQPDCPKR